MSDEHEQDEADRSDGDELVPLLVIVDVGDRKLVEERLVPPEVAAAIERGERIVDLSGYELAVRMELDKYRELLAVEKSASKTELATLRTRRDQIEAAHPELREERRKKDE